MKTIREILEDNNYIIYSETSEFYKTNALYRGGDNKTALSINKETGVWKDFVTQKTGDINELIKLTSGESSNFSFVKEFSSKDLMKDLGVKFQTEDIPELLPSYSFYNKRGISNKTLQEFRSGLCTYGKMNSRFVFPIYSCSGDLVGLSGRDLLNKPYRPKWKILGKKSSWCYPLFISEPHILQEKSVILVESIGDMLALYENNIKNCLVLFGLSIGNEMLASLIQMPINRIFISTNNDFSKSDNVGEIAASKIKFQLSKWFDVSKLVISLPPRKDFGDCSNEEIQTWYKNIDLN